MDTAVTLAFADGEYRFWLPLPQVVALERKCGDTSIFVIEERLRAAIGVDADGGFTFVSGGSAMISDVRETIRLGLTGGNSGMVDGEEKEVGPIAAGQLTDQYVYPARPLSEGVVTAWRILHAAIYGIQLKKKDAAKPAPKRRSRSPKVS